MAMFAFTAIWATNIHDAVAGNTEPVMGAKYHTVRIGKGDRVRGMGRDAWGLMSSSDALLCPRFMVSGCAPICGTLRGVLCGVFGGVAFGGVLCRFSAGLSFFFVL